MYALLNSELDPFFNIIEKLSVRKPPGPTKLEILKEIAKEHQIDLDTTDSEQELQKPHQELIVLLKLSFFCAFFCLLHA